MAENLNVYAAEPAATGTCFVAPIGGTAVAPTKADFIAGDPLDVAFVDLGHIGEDGYTETKEVNLEDKRNFGGKVVKVLQTEVSYTYKWQFMESLNGNVLKAVYGAENVTITAATGGNGAIVEVKKTARKLPHQQWVLDTIDSGLGSAGKPARYRSYIPDGQIVEIGDVTIVHSDIIFYEITLRAFEDPSGAFIYTWADSGGQAGAGT